MKVIYMEATLKVMTQRQLRVVNNVIAGKQQEYKYYRNEGYLVIEDE